MSELFLLVHKNINVIHIEHFATMTFLFKKADGHFDKHDKGDLAEIESINKKLFDYRLRQGNLLYRSIQLHNFILIFKLWIFIRDKLH